MSDLFWLTDAQMARLERFFPKSHGEQKTVVIDVSTRTPCVRVRVRKDLKAHRTATSIGVKKGGVDA